ncbi:O-antigen ligase family protein [Candidatus Pelagibacter bacterium]|nr:O-antigen ligase family protein [Candidatus Pelagibacter bacterium]
MFLKNNLISYLHLSLYILPASLIIGSLVVNINLAIFLIFSIIYIYKNNLKIQFDLVNISLFLFFLTLIISSLVNIRVIGLENFVKSIFLLKFFLLFLFLDTLIKNNRINLEIFFKICSFTVLFVALDVLLQFVFGKNILGFSPHEGRITGIFGSEAIAGAYIQKFFIFGLIGIFLITYLKNYKININEILFFSIVLCGSFVASNRMSFIIMLFLFLFLTLFYKIFRKKLLICLMIALPVFMVLFKTDPNINIKFNNFKIKSLMLLEKSISLFDEEINKNIKLTNHGKIYISSIRSFNENKTLGGGLKSFRYQCPKFVFKDNTFCSTHPHNYHLEILHDTGIIGYFLLTFFVIALLISKYKSFKSPSLNYVDKIIFSLIILNFLVEIFPLKSTGSLFSTWTGTILWLSIAMINYDKKIINKNY